MNHICNNCGKEFELSKGQLKMHNSAGVSNFYCSKECLKKSINQRSKERYYNDIEKSRKYQNEQARKYYNKNKSKISSKSSNKELSPNQLGYDNLTHTEKRSMISKLSGAQVNAYKTNKYSKRRGVQLKLKYNKKTGAVYSSWWVEKQINNVIYRKRCDSEEEAIMYIEELENKYFTPEQLAVRDKYKKLNRKKE